MAAVGPAVPPLSLSHLRALFGFTDHLASMQESAGAGSGASEPSASAAAALY